jgi:PAS domain S-box-containing protein
MSEDGSTEHSDALLAENLQLKEDLEQLRAEISEHQESVELYQLITRHVADLLAIVDVNGNRIWNNRAYRNTLGYSPEELEQTNSFIEIHPDDRNLVQQTFSESIETGVGKTIEYRMKHKNGRWIPLESNAQVVREENGSVRAVVIVARDMTDRLRNEEEQEKLQKMQALAEFSEKVATTYNEFSSEIISKVSMVRKAFPEGAAEKLLLTDVIKEAEKSQKLGRELLSLSGGGGFECEEVDFRKLVSKAMEANIPKGKGIKLQQQITNLPMTVPAAAEAIENVLAELFRNAAESMPKGGVLQVTLTFERKEGVSTKLKAGNYAALKIRDQGQGIPGHLKNRIFEPYYTTKDGHQGMGLSTALKAVTDHAGALFIESKERIGTEVSLYLPTSTAPVEDIGSNSTMVTFAKPKASPVVKKTGRRVLIMDDEEFVRDFSVAMFEQLGYEAHAVEDCDALMDEFRDAQRRRQSYHLVVTDMIVRGGEGGEDVAQKLKAISPFTKVIAVSGVADHPVILEPEKYGFHAAMGKPYQLNRIRHILNMLFPDT